MTAKDQAMPISLASRLLVFQNPLAGQITHGQPTTTLCWSLSESLATRRLDQLGIAK
jgi:hypothetical protein